MSMFKIIRNNTKHLTTVDFATNETEAAEKVAQYAQLQPKAEFYFEYKFNYDHTHPVAVAVDPLRTDAVNHARDAAKQAIADATESLIENGWDLQTVAPYPSTKNGLTRAEYRAAVERHNFFQSFTENANGNYSLNGPKVVRLVPKYIDKVIRRAGEDAGFQYDSFVMKLIGKIGQCDAAALTGSHVWGFSFLTVRKGDTVEKWKTSQIVNRSKLGNAFYQWPSRLVK